MPESQLLELVEDIKSHGQREPIVIFEEMILDGWHRHTACQIAGVSTRATDFEGENPAAFVESKNAHRRDITASQRAALIVALRQWRPSETIKPGEGATVAPLNPATNAEMAKAANVSKRTIQYAKAAEAAGLGKQVRAGDLTAAQAASMARLKDPKPKRTTELEKAQNKIKEMDALIVDLRESITDLIDTIEAYDHVSLDADERVKEHRRLTAKVNALESQLNEKTILVLEWQREAFALGRKLKGRK